MKPALTVVSRYVMPLCCAAVLLSTGAHAADELKREPIDAITVEGDKVRLYPNGRWEFVDAIKAAKASEQAAQYPENKTRPAEAQGGLFGIGRTIMPGDKDYNRGSMSGKGR